MEKQVKKAKAEKQAADLAAAVQSMDAANRKLRADAYADGRWATWQMACQEMLGKAKSQAKKDNGGQNGSFADVRKILKSRITAYLTQQGLVQTSYVGDALATSKVFSGYVDEMVAFADPPKAFVRKNDAKDVKGNVVSFSGKPEKPAKPRPNGRPNPKGNKRDDGADKPNADGTPEDIANYFLGKAAEESDDGTMASALNAAGVKAS
jgi:hypothetical protein